MASSAFTSKNKNNLQKYLANNLQTILNTKDFVNRHIKIVPYLLVAIFIARQLREKQKLQSHHPIDKLIVVGLMELSQSCWSYQQGLVRTLTSLLYAQLFDIKTKELNQEELMKPLYDGISVVDKSATVTAIIGYMCKYN